jgi:protein-S-isoprenylcysteine O-methyltransferase Ste14
VGGACVSAISIDARRAIATRVVTSIPVAVLWILFAVANFTTWRSTHRPNGLGAVVLELIVATLFILRRTPWVVSRSPVAWFAAAVGTFGWLWARPAYEPIGGIDPLYVGLQLAGVVLAGASVISLGRSFGIVAANRGIRTSGPYRFVRHPLYSAYVVTVTGYLLENPSVRNVCLYAAVSVCQVARIREEERTLSADPAYREYCTRVRSRVIPFVV